MKSDITVNLSSSKRKVMLHEKDYIMDKIRATIATLYKLNVVPEDIIEGDCRSVPASQPSNNSQRRVPSQPVTANDDDDFEKLAIQTPNRDRFVQQTLERHTAPSMPPQPARTKQTQSQSTIEIGDDFESIRGENQASSQKKRRRGSGSDDETDETYIGTPSRPQKRQKPSQEKDISNLTGYVNSGLACTDRGTGLLLYRTSLWTSGT